MCPGRPHRQALRRRRVFVFCLLYAQAPGSDGVAWNPVARHLALAVQANKPTVCTLVGHEDTGQPVDYLVWSLPTRGSLHETSPGFRTERSGALHVLAPLEPQQLPFRVTDPLNRVVYLPPANEWPPEGLWESFVFVVNTSLTALSEPGLVVLSGPRGRIVASSFNSAGAGAEGWSLSGNLDKGAQPVHQAFVWGAMSNYIYGADAVQWVDFGTGLDLTRWYFEAPQAAFLHRPEVVAAYGGILRFKVQALHGNFSELNAPLDWVTLECASCNSGRGLRIVRHADRLLHWDGKGKTVEVVLQLGQNWRREPLSSTGSEAEATQCEIVAVLANLSRVAILGDWTTGGEAIALDDVEIVAPGGPAAAAPAVPVACQQGCPCRGGALQRSLSCCGGYAAM